MEKVEICTNLNVKDEVASRVIKSAQESVTASCSSLKSRLLNTQKLVNSLLS